MCDINIVRNSKNPKILVSTPLLPGHKISKITKKTIKRNDIDYTWLSTSSNNNIPVNHTRGIEWYEKHIGNLPECMFFLDRDIDLGRHALDRLYNTLKKESAKTQKRVGYAYASFKYVGYINYDFPAIPFDVEKLLKANYISSNSLFYSDVIKDVGLVTDNKYKRLLDYAFLIKCLANEIGGTPCPSATFRVNSTPDDISSGSDEEYMIKYRRVFEDFIRPLFKRKRI